MSDQVIKPYSLGPYIAIVLAIGEEATLVIVRNKETGEKTIARFEKPTVILTKKIRFVRIRMICQDIFSVKLCNYRGQYILDVVNGDR